MEIKRKLEMKKLAIILCILIAASAFASAQIAVIPKPAEINKKKGSFTIDPNTAVVADALAAVTADSIAEFLEPAAGFKLKIKKEIPEKNFIQLKIDQFLHLNPEAYTIDITPENAVLAASTPKGLFYAFQTLRQLFSPQIERKQKVSPKKWSLPCVSIKDQPEFPFRAMHLDTARHFVSKENIKKFIDYLAMYKFNTFHWHLTDDQGWRIEIKKYPKLQEIAQYRENIGFEYNQHIGLNQADPNRYGGIYTQKDIKEIVAYAKSRHIEIIPEIEMPGHCTAALAAYPELGCTGGPYKTWTEAGVSKDVFCAGNAQTYIFLKDVIKEVITLFPGKYIHVGGDEVPKERWKVCKKCRSTMTQNNLTSMNELQNYFIHQITDFVKQNNKTPIVWDDAMNDKLDPNIIVMSWRDYDGGIQAARQGHKVIMTPNRLTYLNRRQSDDPNSPGHTIITSLQTVYTFDPIPDQLTNQEASNIIGGQGCLWTEYVPEFKYVEYQLFPRMLAISDILWTTHTKDFNDLQSRIEFNSVRLKEMNVNQYLPPAPVDANSAKAIKNETAIAP